MRKKLLSVFALVVFLLSLTACGVSSNSSSISSGQDLNSSKFSADNPTTQGTNASGLESAADQYLNSKKVETARPEETVTTPPVSTVIPKGSTTTPRITTTKPSVTVPTPSAPSNPDFLSEVVRLVNIERSKAGLGGVSASSTLNAAASIRANEIITSFSHTRPNGTSCFTVLTQLNIPYNTCGENIAAGQATPQEVMTGWMNSPGHKANIMNPSFKQLGVGYVKGGSYGHNWVQIFTN